MKRKKKSPQYLSSSPGETIIHLSKGLNERAEPEEGGNSCRKAVGVAFVEVCHLFLKERENGAECGALILKQCAADQNRWAFLNMVSCQAVLAGLEV